MIALKITDTKTFMSKLLIKDTFHDFSLTEAEITTFSTLKIDGSINKAFYTAEELEALGDQPFATWKQIQPYCFNFVKGTKTPTSMKLIYALPAGEVTRLLTENGLSYSISDIEGLFLNFKYADGGVSCITGTSVRFFTMDKSLDHALDAYTRKFLLNAGIDFEEE